GYANPANAAKMSLNGQMTKALSAGQSEIISTTMKVTVVSVKSGSAVSFQLEPGTYLFTPEIFPPNSIPDTLNTLETKTYTLGGSDYEVLSPYVGIATGGTSATAKISVNGELTKALTVGR